MDITMAQVLNWGVHKSLGDAKSLVDAYKSLEDAQIPGGYQIPQLYLLGCSIVCRVHLSPWGDAKLPSVVHLGCQMLYVCRGCLNPGGMAYSPVHDVHLRV